METPVASAKELLDSRKIMTDFRDAKSGNRALQQLNTCNGSRLIRARSCKSETSPYLYGEIKYTTSLRRKKIVISAERSPEHQKTHIQVLTETELSCIKTSLIAVNLHDIHS